MSHLPCSTCSLSQRVIPNHSSNIHYPLSGLPNLIDYSCIKRHFSLSRSLVFTLQRTSSDYQSSYLGLRSSVIHSPRVLNGIEASTKEDLKLLPPEKYEKTLKKNEQRCLKILSEMESSMCSWLIRITGFALSQLLRVIFSDITVSVETFFQVQNISKDNNCSIVYLPLHRSHLDYILMAYACWCWNLRLPHVAAGDNLNIPIFSWFFRRYGGFFIRRKLDPTGSKDHLYRSVLHSYMLELLRRKESMEFFIEAGRTRSGKALMPKAGLFSVVADACKTGVVQDVWLVPVSVTYERIPDGSFSKELLGEPKQRETVWSFFLSIWRAVRSHFGRVHMTFSAPYSFKTLFDHLNSNEPESFEKERSQIQSICDHILFVTRTSILCFILLNKHREGCSLSVLQEGFFHLEKILSQRAVVLAFPKDDKKSIVEGIKILAEQGLVELEYSDVDSGIEVDCFSAKRRRVCRQDEEEFTPGLLIRPKVEAASKALDLSYYANGVLSILLLDSVLAVSVLSFDEECSLDALIERACTLCHLLRFEFLFVPPCERVEERLKDLLEYSCDGHIKRFLQGEKDLKEIRVYANALGALIECYAIECGEGGERIFEESRNKESVSNCERVKSEGDVQVGVFYKVFGKL